MNFTVVGQTHLGRQLDPGINGNTVEGFLIIELAVSDLIRANHILVKDIDGKLVLTAFTQVESKGFVPNGVVVIFNNTSTLLVIIINIDFTID